MMRLIYFFSVLFGFYSNSFVRAAPVLDLDNYNPEDVVLKIEPNDNYNLENFTPKEGDNFADVTYAGTSLLGQGDGPVTKAQVFTVQGLPQLVKLELAGGENGELLFEKTSAFFAKLTLPKFNEAVQKLENGTFKPDLTFTLNLSNRANPRQLVSVDTDVWDGVLTHQFTPSLPELHVSKVVVDGEAVTYPQSNQHLTRVTANEKQGGDVVLVKAEFLDGNETKDTYFEKVGNTWKPVHAHEYENTLRGLHPLNNKNVTLDLLAGEHDEYVVKKDYERGLVKTTYSPLPGFHVGQVKQGTTPLWGSDHDRVTKVFVLTVRGANELVKLTVRNGEGDSFDVNLVNEAHGLVEASDNDFSNKLAKFENAAKETSGKSELTTELDLLSPNNFFTSSRGRHLGAPFKRFTPKLGVKVNSVNASTHKVWTPAAGQSFTYATLYFKDSLPHLCQVYGRDDKGEDVLASYEFSNKHGEWYPFDSRQLFSFVTNFAKSPRLTTPLVLNVEDPNDQFEHVTTDNYKLMGVPAVSFQANDGFYFRKVNWLGKEVFSTEKGFDGMAVDRVEAYQDKFGFTRLLALGGFDDGEYYQLFYRLWAKASERYSKVQFDEYFHGLKQEHEREYRKQNPVANQQVPEEPGEVPEEPVQEPQEPVQEPQEPVQEAVPAEEPKPLPKDEELPSFSGKQPVKPHEEEPEEPEIHDLVTENVDENFFTVVNGTENGYYFSSYAPKHLSLIGNIRGPAGFKFNSDGFRFVTLVKFFYVHSKVVGAQVHTVRSAVNLTGELTYYYTFEDEQWDYTTNKDTLVNLLVQKTTYTREQKEELKKSLEADEKYKKTMEKLKAEREKKLEKELKKNKPKVPGKLSQKTLLYEDMAKLEDVKAPESPTAAPLTQEELNERRQSYAGGDLLVEAELVYYDLSNPHGNKFVHTKDFLCMGLNALDATPLAGKVFHALSVGGRRVWIGPQHKRCTNLQLLYDDDQLVGAVLRLKTKRRFFKTKTGEDFDYLFVTDGELKVVKPDVFTSLANARFQRAALVGLS